MKKSIEYYRKKITEEMKDRKREMRKAAAWRK